MRVGWIGLPLSLRIVVVGGGLGREVNGFLGFSFDHDAFKGVGVRLGFMMGIGTTLRP